MDHIGKINFNYNESDVLKIDEILISAPNFREKTDNLIPESIYSGNLYTRSIDYKTVGHTIWYNN